MHFRKQDVFKKKKFARGEMLLYPWEITSGRPAQVLAQELLAMSLDFITDPAIASVFHVTKRKVHSDLYSPISLASDWVKPGHVMQLWRHQLGVWCVFLGNVSLFRKGTPEKRVSFSQTCS